MPDPICRHCNDPQSEHAQRVWCRTTPNTCTFEPVERSKPEVEQELPNATQRDGVLYMGYYMYEKPPRVAEFADILAFLPKLSQEQRIAIAYELSYTWKDVIVGLEQERDAAIQSAKEHEQHADSWRIECRKAEKEGDSAKECSVAAATEYERLEAKFNEVRTERDTEESARLAVERCCSNMEVEAIQLRGRVADLEKERDAAIARAADLEKANTENQDFYEGRITELEGQLVRAKEYGDIAELLSSKLTQANDECDELRAQVASVAERQREACAEAFAQPPYPNDFQQRWARTVVRETPLVTDTPIDPRPSANGIECFGAPCRVKFCSAAVEREGEACPRHQEEPKGESGTEARKESEARWERLRDRATRELAEMRKK